MYKLAHGFMVVALFFAFACGGDDDGGFGTCEEIQQEFAACGGDLQGSWEIRDTCHQPLPALGLWDSWCPDAVVNNATLDFETVVDIDETTIQFGVMTLLYGADVRFQEACLADVGLDCAGVQAAFNQDPIITANCAEEGPDCRCDISATNDVQAYDTGYSIEGTELIIEDEEGETDRMPYCVSGDEMVWQAPPDSESPVTHIVFRKR